MAGSQSSRAGAVRRAKACNTCRRKKTKCDGKRPICSSCHAFNFSCAFQDTAKEPIRSSRAYVADLERRVQNLEAQLQQSSSNARHDRELPDDAGDEDLGSTDYDSGIDQASYVINGRDGRMRFFGASSGLSVATSHGASRLGIGTWRSAARKGATPWQLTSWFPRILQDDFEKRAFQPLPSRNIAIRLVDEFFADLNQAIPLFGRASFMRLLDRQFSWNPDESPSWWASLNVVLAFAYRQRAQRTEERCENWQLSLAHIKNAMNVTMEFFMRAADLLTVQAMLGLAIYFQGTPNPQSLFMFASTAMRLSQSIGLHRGFTFGLNTPEIEERRRVSWIAFILDADISLRVGRPPAQDEHDYDTPLPPENPSDGKGVLVTGGAHVNFFRLLSQLSLIQRRVYQRLYAASAQQQPREIIVKEVKACAEALLEWKRSATVAFESHSTVPQCSSSQHILRLKLAYYCCFANLYRVCVLAGQPGPYTNARPTVEVEIAQAVVASLESARSAVGLIKQARIFESSYQWNVVYFPAAACGTLALEIFMSPDHERTKNDYLLICETVKYLSEIAAQEPGTYVDHVLGVCSEFKAASKRVLEHGSRSSNQGQRNTNPKDIDRFSDLSKTRPHFHEGVNDATPSTGPMATHEALNDSATHIQPLDGDLGLFDMASDPMMNWQWSIPPFWNWQDMMGDTTPAPEIGNENSPDSYDPSLGA